MTARDLPFLDFTNPGFSTRSEEVYAARAAHWAARTPYGLAVLRHKEAGFLLRDRRLRQGSYAWPKRMGLNGAFADFWTRSVISQEGRTHQAQRRLLVDALSVEFVNGLKPAFAKAAEKLLFEMRDKTKIEFMEAFSRPFAGMVNCALLGLPMADWETVSADATALGLAMGVECKSHEPVFNQACENLMTLAQRLIARARIDPSDQSFPARLTRAFDSSAFRGEQILRDLIVISIFGGVDTTKGQLGFLMWLFSQNPDQWAALRRDPNLADAAINEAIRMRPTTTWATREATVDLTFEGLPIAKGTTVHILSHATGTDPQKHDGGFDITAKRHIHFGFGGGAHHCVGHYLARSDMSVALKCLAREIADFELCEARFHPDSGNTSPITLDLNVTR